MTSIDVVGLTKVFSLASRLGRTVSFFEALRSGVNKNQRRKIQALDNLNFSVQSGERIGIIGRNGAGKTTLLSVLAGIAQPTSGKVKVRGNVHAMLTIGAVLKEDLTGRDNIVVDATVHQAHRDDIKDIVRKVIAFSELEDFIDRPVRTYSSGMKARLAFSMSAFVNPDILILDETLAVGDVFFAQKAGRQMKEIAERGRIVVMVTHATSSVVEMCNRCLWMDNGRIVMDGDPKEVTEAYEQALKNDNETDLRKRFADDNSDMLRPDSGSIEEVQIIQIGNDKSTLLNAGKPVAINVSGYIRAMEGENCDIKLELLRVDGRKLWHDSLQKSGSALSGRGAFKVRISLDPFVLGEDLYRLNVRLTDAAGVIDCAAKVFEVYDKIGQFGGQPLIFYSPKIDTKKIAENMS